MGSSVVFFWLKFANTYSQSSNLIAYRVFSTRWSGAACLLVRLSAGSFVCWFVSHIPGQRKWIQTSLRLVPGWCNLRTTRSTVQKHNNTSLITCDSYLAVLGRRMYITYTRTETLPTCCSIIFTNVEWQTAISRSRIGG